MRSCIAISFVLSLATFVTGTHAQEDPTVTRAIEDLGSESPAVQARARTTILKAGQTAIDAVQRALSVAEGMPVERMFAVADEIGRERRGVRLTASNDLKKAGWRIGWRRGGQQLAFLQTDAPMPDPLLPQRFVLRVFAGLVNREQARVVDYLREENRVLREQLGKRRLQLTDPQRARLAIKAKALGRSALAVVTIVTPDTLFRWHILDRDAKFTQQLRRCSKTLSLRAS